MPQRDHLKRLPPEFYRGHASIHWTSTIAERKTGWLTPAFYYRFRELLTHTTFRYGLACPIFCLMPDHFHMVLMGLFDRSDQLLAMRHLRKNINDSLKRIGFLLQDQAYDHVFNDDERRDAEFQNACMYVARNPERAELVPVDGYAEYPFSSCLIPGHPQLRPFEPRFWEHFDRVTSYLRKEGTFIPFRD